ncbi:hypothetical protein U0070_024601, partial [Myodes glareolus]
TGIARSHDSLVPPISSAPRYSNQQRGSCADPDTRLRGPATALFPRPPWTLPGTDSMEDQGAPLGPYRATKLNHVIEDIKGRWGSENLDDNNQLFRFPATSPLKTLPQRHTEIKRTSKEYFPKDKDSIFKLRNVSRKTPKKHGLHFSQSILGVPSIEDLINPDQVIPQYIMYNMSNTSKHGVVVLQDKSGPRSNETNNPTYVGFERDVFRTIADYFLDLPEPLLTFKYYELFVNIMGLLQPHLERVAINALQLCCLLLPPPNRRKLQLLMRMISRMSQNIIHTFSRCVLCCAEEVDLDELLASRLISFLMDHHQEILQVPTYLQTAVEKHLDYIRKGHFKNPGEEQIVPLPTYSYCKQISTQEFDKQKISTSQAAVEELLENIIRSKSLPPKEKRRKLKQFQKEYPLVYQNRFPTPESEAALLDVKPTIKQPMLNLRNPKLHRLRY